MDLQFLLICMELKYQEFGKTIFLGKLMKKIEIEIEEPNNSIQLFNNDML